MPASTILSCTLRYLCSLLVAINNLSILHLSLVLFLTILGVTTIYAEYKDMKKRKQKISSNSNSDNNIETEKQDISKTPPEVKPAR